ncbi:cell division protein SepF [Staphylococcus chromogenes]|nr:cell division protein SepF [Staphylococcus chromogenes]
MDFFGLAPVDGDLDEAYYADERRYDAAPAYAEERAVRDYAAPVRALEPTIVSVRLADFKEANRVAEPFRDGDAVVFDISDMAAEDARRVVDFSAGLCFALRGDMKKLAPRVFAVIPERAHISTYELEDAARLR